MPLFTAVVLGIIWMAIVFAAITWRHSDGEAVPELVATEDETTAGAGRSARRRSSCPSPYLMQMAYRFTFAGADSSRFSSPIPHVVSDTGPFATAMITALSAANPPLRTFWPASQTIWNA